MSQTGTYVGRHLPPLPHESPFSMVARTVWLNQMSGTKFQHLAGLSKSSYSKGILAQDNEMLERIFFHMGWSLEPTPTVADDWPRWSRPFFFSSRLRTCDECVSGMYHSTWHQFMGMAVCPLHGGPLRDACPTCHQPLGTYTLSTAAVCNFVCHHCRNSLSGKPLAVGDHIRFRENGRRLRTTFASSERALLRLHAGLDSLKFLGRRFPYESVNLWWPDGLMGWQIVADIQAAYQRNTPGKPALTWLVWPVQRGNRLQGREWYLIYSETVWRLKKWLMHRYPQCLHAGDRPELFDSRNVPRSDAWPPEVLAFMLMRYDAESAGTWGLSAAIDGIPDLFREASWFQPFDSQNLQAESVRAMVLGRFAAYYWWVKSGCPIADRVVKYGPTLACWHIKRVWEPSIGAIAFPPIENMPLERFDPSPLRLSDALELVRRDALWGRRMAQSYRLGNTSEVVFQPVEKMSFGRFCSSRFPSAWAMELIHRDLLVERRVAAEKRPGAN
ncbi:hypothetical protein G2912_21420 [Paraburkholderia aspalathi]|uniref:TniQ protein n=1 Tax=Paraburkholderia nemoris TaxID=2793076 RepID=A0ABM8S4P3_9BURK|nr:MULTISPECIES: hypothetical protein [Paraburkholderia]MBK3812920.1 hypothetical protein [Paraburkholderia aspalathi]CAE6788935.1 hypothetical protein R69776_04662 [Paraburkholderia nemoris]